MRLNNIEQRLASVVRDRRSTRKPKPKRRHLVIQTQPQPIHHEH